MRIRAARAFPLALALVCGFAVAAPRAQGISESEYRNMRAPPMALSVRLEAGAARLSWGAPEPRPGEAVARYRIERVAARLPLRPIGETRTTVFLDRAPPKGRVTYVVTALSPKGRALRRSAPARVVVP